MRRLRFFLSLGSLARALSAWSGAETAGRIAESAYHARKLRPYRQAVKAERRLEKAKAYPRRQRGTW